MKNKKKFIYLIIGIAFLLFVALYLIINYSEPNVLDSKDKKWISENSGRVIDIDVINDLPVFANNGVGVVFDFLNYVTKETKLDFNKRPYLRGSTNLNSSYKVQILDGSQNLSSNDLLIADDYFVLVGKKDEKVERLKDLEGLTLGVLKDNSSMMAYYLENVSNLRFYTYDTKIELFNALDSNAVNMVIAPQFLNLERIVNGEYHVNYFFNNVSNNIVLSMNGNNKELNNIITKLYHHWFEEEYVKDYNKTYLNYYMASRNINDKTRADLLSKTYVYGYVENYPYEFSEAANMEGIAIEYIKRIIRLTDIDVTYKKYDSISALNNGINKGEVDIYFDYFNSNDSKYLKSKSVFIENYVRKR